MSPFSFAITTAPEVVERVDFGMCGVRSRQERHFFAVMNMS